MKDWKIPSSWKTVRTIEAHTGGEPLRIILDGFPEPEGKTILEKRRWVKENYDYLRRGLMWEPRGHADMYGAIITEACSPDGDCGVLFTHNEGYSSMCGHGIIAMTKVLLETGQLPRGDENQIIRIDAPAGRITATAHWQGDIVQEVSFLNVPSFLYKKDLNIPIDGIGYLRCDIAYGGAFYVYCQAADLDIKVLPENHDALIEIGRRIKNTVMEQVEIVHPYEEDLGFLYGTIIIDKPGNPENHSRNVCIFAEGEVDRSPTGTGVSARAAIHHAKGELSPGEEIVIESILGTTMKVKVHDTLQYDKYQAVVPQVTGSASIVGRSEFLFDPEDPLKDGFIFR
jgi:proline racemase